MAKGEREQAKAKQARKTEPTNAKKSPRVVSGEAEFRQPVTGAGTRNRRRTSSANAGARQGNARSAGKKPSGTNVSKSGGSSAKGSK